MVFGIIMIVGLAFVIGFLVGKLSYEGWYRPECRMPKNVTHQIMYSDERAKDTEYCFLVLLLNKETGDVFQYRFEDYPGPVGSYIRKD